MTIFTIGHSTRPIEEFIGILKAHGMERVVDIRTVPRSRRNPQFNRDILPESLARSGIAYEHIAALGGLRHARPDSLNTGWRNASFRGYADYMATEQFAGGLERLLEVAPKTPSAMMCAESVPWRCHRSLVADALTARGITVMHIMNASKAVAHSMTPFARIDDGVITYREQPDYKKSQDAP
jgi:uncharacterized protein (DUF488 family)